MPICLTILAEQIYFRVSYIYKVTSEVLISWISRSESRLKWSPGQFSLFVGSSWTCHGALEMASLVGGGAAPALTIWPQLNAFHHAAPDHVKLLTTTLLRIVKWICGSGGGQLCLKNQEIWQKQSTLIGTVCGMEGLRPWRDLKRH